MMRAKKIQKPRKKDKKNENDTWVKNYMKCTTAQLTVIFQLDRVEERGRDPTKWIKVVQNDKKKDKRKDEKMKVDQMEIKLMYDICMIVSSFLIHKMRHIIFF